LKGLGTKTICITPDRPWENGYCESFNGKLRDELRNGELFYTFGEAQVLIERWRVFCNTKRSHSALRYRPPAPETFSSASWRKKKIGLVWCCLSDWLVMHKVR